MAPRPPLGRRGVLAALRNPAGPPSSLQLGSPNVCAAIVVDDGVWRLRRTVLDHDALDRFARDRIARGQGFYPEHSDPFQRPTGEVLLEAPDLASFCAAIEGFDWPNDL